MCKEKCNYELKTTGASSEKYGVCEVCGKHASEVFFLTDKNNYMYGHKECLLKQIK